MPDLPEEHAVQNKVSVRSHRTTPTNRQLYGTQRWRMSRLSFLHRHPLCLHCKADNRITAATEVDHILPHRGDPKLFWSVKNWQALCKPCHSRKTAKEDGGFGNALGG